MGPLFYRKGVSLVLGLRRLIESSSGPDFLLDVVSTIRRLLDSLPANSPFCGFVSTGYGVWLDILTNGVDPLDFGVGAGGNGAREGSGEYGPLSSSRVGSACFVLYSFATDVLTAASSRVTVLRPGSAALVDNYAYVGPLSSLAGASGPVVPPSSSGVSFVFGLVPYSIPAVLPVGLLSASPSGLGCVSLSLSSSAGAGGDVVGDDAGFDAGGFVGDAGVVSAGSSGIVPESILLVLRDYGDDGGGILSPPSPPLSYYTWSFVRSSLSRFYVSVGVGSRHSLASSGLLSPPVSPPVSPLRFSDLSVRFSGFGGVSDGNSSEDEITSLVRSVRRAFD